jgi:hypothetical protein
VNVEEEEEEEDEVRKDREIEVFSLGGFYIHLYNKCVLSNQRIFFQFSIK